MIDEPLMFASLTVAALDHGRCKISFRLRGPTEDQEAINSVAELASDLERRLQGTGCDVVLRQGSQSASIAIRGTLPLSEFLHEIGRLAATGALVALYAEVVGPTRTPAAQPESPS